MLCCRPRPNQEPWTSGVSPYHDVALKQAVTVLDFEINIAQQKKLIIESREHVAAPILTIYV